MKRAVLTLVLAMSSASAMAGDTEGVLWQRLVERIPDIKIDSIRKLPDSDLYEVVYNKRTILYTDASGNLGVSGNL
jgi:hypothetical protein